MENVQLARKIADTITTVDVAEDTIQRWANIIQGHSAFRAIKLYEQAIREAEAILGGEYDLTNGVFFDLVHEARAAAQPEAKDAEIKQLQSAIDGIAAFFVSGNSVPIERATLSTNYIEVRTLLALASAAPANDTDKAEGGKHE